MGRSLFEYAVVLLLLGIAVRTFVAVGWLVPLAVSGGSMAPHFVGPHQAWRCTACDTTTLLPTEAESLTVCPCCGARATGTATRETRPGEHLFASRWKNPQRWDMVLLRPPTDARQLWVKRIVGLPGELISFRDGDLWANGKRVVKTWDQQRRLRLQVGSYLAWSGEGWQEKEGTWHCQTVATSRLRSNRELTDDLAWNHRLTRKLNSVDDRMIACHLTLDQGATCVVDLGRYTARLDEEGITLKAGGAVLAQHPIRGLRSVDLVCSSFDQAATIVIDGGVVFAERLPPGEAARCEVLASGGVTLRELSVWRDVYYEAPEGAWQLEARDWFVVGDNPAVSVDSRHWGRGLPGRLLVGVVQE